VICVDLDLVCLKSVATTIDRFARGEIEEQLVHRAGHFRVGHDAVGKRSLSVRASRLRRVNRSVSRTKQCYTPFSDSDFTPFTDRDLGD
jgi:hypothetical protein|tara:strand:+ start:278 stop:544 length:267 start_codon:yes stop_codon:yes gene_type:complete